MGSFLDRTEIGDRATRVKQMCRDGHAVPWSYSVAYWNRAAVAYCNRVAD